MSSLKISYINVRGLRGKLTSLKVLLHDNQIDVALIVEAKVPSLSPNKIPGYKWFPKLTDSETCNFGAYISHNICRFFVLEPDTYNNNCFFLRVCLPMANHFVLGTIHGVQESSSTEQATLQFNELSESVLEYHRQNLPILIMGDFNAKVGADHLGIQGNNPIISRNGKLLRDLINSTGLIMLNSSEKCSGLWTRVNTKKSSEKSVIDYALASPTIADNINNLIIDDKEFFKLSGRCKTDHNTFIAFLSLPHFKVKPPLVTGWKINDNTRWEIFSNSLSFNNLSPTPDTSMYAAWEQHVLEVAEKSIGTFVIDPSRPDPLLRSPLVLSARAEKRQARKRYSLSIRSKDESRISFALKNYLEKQENLKSILDKQKAIIQEKLLKKINDTGGTRSKKFWSLVRQCRRPNTEDLLAVQKEDGTRLFSEKDILEYTAYYFENLYSPTISEAFSPQWTNYISNKVNEFSQINSKSFHPMNLPISEEEISVARKQLSKGKSPGPSHITYEFLINGGPAMLSSLTKLFNDIFQSETQPIQWQQSHLINLGKGKGEREKLSSKRGITLSECPAKLFEKVLFNRIIKELPFSEAQAGGRVGRGCVDQLFILKSVINQRKFDNKPTFIVFLDIEKAYDKTWVDGILFNLWEKGIQGKIWRVIAEMNRNLTTKVKN